MSSLTINVTGCAQNCIYSFQQSEIDADKQNAICLSTAAIGFLILMSGFQDLHRASSGLILKKHKWTTSGNTILGLIGIFKIANGIAFMANAFAYEPVKWNTEILRSCNKTCSDILSTMPASLPDHDVDPASQCCYTCRDGLNHSNGADNFGIATGFSVPLLIMETAKTVYSICRVINWCLKRVSSRSLVNLPIRQKSIAKTDLIQDMLAVCYAIAVFVLISSNVIGDDQNVYDMDSEYSSTAPGTLISRCTNLCKVLYPGSFQWCF